VQNKAIPTVSPEVQTEELKALGVKAANLPKWARTQKGTRELEGAMGDGAGKREMKCDMCTENDEEGNG
jgi:hypothetical protein